MNSKGKKMKEGLYKIEFSVPGDSGAGVGYLKNGKLHGGDSIIYYLGTYTIEDNKFNAKVKTNVHSTQQGMSSIFGIDSVNIDLTGTINDNIIKLQGRAKEAEHIPFSTTLTWISE